MSLVLHQNDEEWPREDYHVLHGELRVGRIWNNPSGTPEAQWLWTMYGVFSEADAKLSHAGSAATLPEAKAGLGSEWQKWLAWADLFEEAEWNDTPTASNAAREEESRASA
jgi:hypothetical protein